MKLQQLIDRLPPDRQKKIRERTTELINQVSMIKYSVDFYQWTQEQAKYLEEGRLQELDIASLIEEIKSLGEQEYWDLVGCMGELLRFLLEWQLIPGDRTKELIAYIAEQRQSLRFMLRGSPSLKARLVAELVDIYESSKNLIVIETKLDYKDIPSQCPYSLEQALDRKYFPD